MGAEILRTAELPECAGLPISEQKLSLEMSSAGYVKYSYIPLDSAQNQIRVLTLFSSKTERSVLQGTIESVNEDHTHEALSYTWENELRCENLVVGESIIKVTTNLHNALRHLRHRDRTRKLWVDAICIDQESKEEKSHQVRRMHEIYSEAERVLVWLGNSNHETDKVMRFLERNSSSIHDLERLRITLRNAEFTGDLNVYAIRKLKEENAERLSVERASCARGLSKIFNRPWFRRMWVVQEVIAARFDPIVYCGSMTVRWNALSLELRRLAAENASKHSVNTELLESQSMLEFLQLTSKGTVDEGLKPRTLARLLKATSNRDAMDPRDHVYALLGLVAETLQVPIEPDYNRPHSEVFGSAFVHVCWLRQDLDFLLYAPTPDPSKKPSWHPNFSTRGWDQFAHACGWVWSEEFAIDARAGCIGMRQFQLEYNAASASIHVAGIEIGRVSSLMNPSQVALQSKNPEEQYDKTLTSYKLDVMEALLVYFLIEGHAHEALRKRLSPGEIQRKLAACELFELAANGVKLDTLIRSSSEVIGIPVEVYTLLGKIFTDDDAFKQCVKRRWRALDETNYSHNLAFAAYVEVANRVADRYFFTTDTGYIGNASYAVENNDIVCVLFECSWPAILRLQEDGSHKLITFAYVNDAMQGQSMGQFDTAQPRVFAIS